MIKQIAIAFLFCLLSSAALAQNTLCANKPATDVSNACANTRFVHDAISFNGGSCTVLSDAVGDGVTDDTAIILSNIAKATSTGYQCIQVPPGNYYAPGLNTSDTSSTGAITFVGPGKITGAYNAYVHSQSEPSRQVFNGVFAGRSLSKLSITANPTAVLVGDSISEPNQSVKSYPNQSLWTILQQAFNQQNPTKTFTWYNRACGGQTFTTFAQSVAPTALTNCFGGWYKASVTYSSRTNPFTVGATLTQASTGASGVISDLSGTTTGTITLINTNGIDFASDALITDSAGGSATSSSSLTSSTWLSNIQSLNARLLVIAFGMNDRINFSPIQVTSAVSTINSWSLVPDLVFVTNNLPTKLATGADYSNYSSQDGQEGRDFVAGWVRSYAKLNGYGLIDGNRAFHIMRDGIDVANSTTTDVFVSNALTTPYTPTVLSSADFIWDLKFGSTNPLAGDKAVLISTSRPGTNFRQYLEIKDSGSGTVNLRVYTLNINTAAQINNLNVDSGVVIPTTNVEYRVLFKNNQLLLQLGGYTTCPDGSLPIVNFCTVVNSPVQRFGGLFYPSVSISDGSAINFTGSFSAGSYTQTLPWVLDPVVYNLACSNGLNHMCAIGTATVYGPLLQDNSLQAAYQSSQVFLQSATNPQTLNQSLDAEDVFIQRTPATSLTINLPSPSLRARPFTIWDRNGVAYSNPITIAPAAGNTISGPTVIQTKGAAFVTKPLNNGNAWSSGIILGGGNAPGNIPYFTGSGINEIAAGTSGQVLHGGTSPTFSAVDLTNDVVGVLPVANGGTGTSAIISILCASSVAVSTNSTSETILATCTIPAGTLGLNSRVEIETTWSMPNNANSKTPRIRLGGIGGTAFLQASPTASVTASWVTGFVNRNSYTSQVSCGIVNGSCGSGLSTGNLVTSAIDTTATQDLVITGLVASAADTLTLENYVVKLLP